MLMEYREQFSIIHAMQQQIHSLKVLSTSNFFIWNPFNLPACYRIPDVVWHSKLSKSKLQHYRCPQAREWEEELRSEDWQTQNGDLNKVRAWTRVRQEICPGANLRETLAVRLVAGYHFLKVYTRVSLLPHTRPSPANTSSRCPDLLYLYLLPPFFPFPSLFLIPSPSFLATLSIEPQALCTLGKYSSTELHT